MITPERRWLLGSPLLPSSERRMEMSVFQKYPGSGVWYARYPVSRNPKTGKIKPSMVEAYQHKRLGDTTYKGTLYRESTVNREVALLKSVFNLAIRRDKRSALS